MRSRCGDAVPVQDDVKCRRWTSLEMSNCYCRPGIAGGLSLTLRLERSLDALLALPSPYLSRCQTVCAIAIPPSSFNHRSVSKSNRVTGDG